MNLRDVYIIIGVILCLSLGCAAREESNKGEFNNTAHKQELEQKVKDLEQQIKILTEVKEPVTSGSSSGNLDVQYFGPKEAMPNAVVTYNIKVINPYSYPAHQVHVYNYLPKEAQFISASDNGKYDSSSHSIEWYKEKMEANASQGFSYEVRLGDIGVYEVCAFASAQFRECMITRVVKPILSCELTVPPMVLKGSAFSVCLTVHNTGDGAAPEVSAIIKLPELLKFTDGGSEKTWDIGTVPAGKSVQQLWRIESLRVGRCKIDAVLKGGGGISANCAGVAEIVFPELYITKTAPRLIHLGKEVNYKIEVKNIGSAPATGVNVVDQLPPGMEFKDRSEGGTYNELTRSVEWSLGTLRTGESRTLYIKTSAFQENIDPGWKNTVRTSCSEGLTSQAEAITMVEAVPAMHIDSYDTVDPVRIGESTCYVVTIRNEGQTKSTQVQMKMIIPDQSSYVSSECEAIENNKFPGRYDSDSRTVIFDPIPVMNPGDAVVYKVEVMAEGIGDEVNTAVLTFNEFKRDVKVQEPTKFYKD